MAFNREIEKLEEQLKLILSIKTCTDRNLFLLNESHSEIRKIIASRHKKHANIFGNLYNYDLKEMRNNRKNVSINKHNSSNQDALGVYKNSMQNAVESALEYIAEYIH